jgi:ligand-binding SRPBCC domain-containing protein
MNAFKYVLTAQEPPRIIILNAFKSTRQDKLMVGLEELTLINAPIERCFDLARSVEVHLAGNVHCGETAVAAAGVTSGLVGRGQWVTWRAKHFGIRHTLTSEITAVEPPLYFQDTMTHGPFRYMRHDHYFRALSAAVTEMKDVFHFAAPLPLLGRLAEITFLGEYMRSLLCERNVALKQIAESSDWQRYLP